MAEYIKLDDAINAIADGACIFASSQLNIGAAMLRAFGKIKKADVRENVHGEWIPYNPIYSDVLCCSKCECEYMPAEAEFFNYCPNCGAEMRGEIDG